VKLAAKGKGRPPARTMTVELADRTNRLSVALAPGLGRRALGSLAA
jgi:hypothetical protein